MTKDEAITIQTRDANWSKFPVFVWQDGRELMTRVDGKAFRALTAFGIDSLLDDAGIPAPRNLYFLDAPDDSDCYAL